MNCAFFAVGLGPSKSNAGDISGFDDTPTFVETLVAQNQISEPIFGIYIAPLGADGTPKGTGEITFGGIDESKIQGDEIFFKKISFPTMYIYIVVIFLLIFGPGFCFVDEIIWVPQVNPVNFHWEFNVYIFFILPQFFLISKFFLTYIHQVLSFGFGSVNLTTPTVARTDTGVLIIGLP